MARILHLTLAFTPGGRRRAIETLLERLPGHGVHCDLVCLNELGGDCEALSAGVVASLDRRSLLDRRALGRFATICRQQRTELIHAHDAASQFLAALTRLQRPKLRLMMTFHRTLGFESATVSDRWRNALATALSQAIVTGSRERREHYLSENYVDARKVIRIPFGIDADRFGPDAEARASMRSELGLGGATTVLGAVGHLGPEKGIDVVIRGYAALVRRGIDSPTTLIVVGTGTGDQIRAMHELAESLGLRIEVPGAGSSTAGAGRILFAGYRRDVERWFQAFDVFVHGARQEAFGLVLAEAMASGLAVVASGVGGALDLVREGTTGRLVPPANPEALATALAELVGDEDRRLAMGARARLVALSEYTADLYAARHARLYRDLIAGRSPRGIDEAAAEPLRITPSPVNHRPGSRIDPNLPESDLESMNSLQRS